MSHDGILNFSGPLSNCQEYQNRGYKTTNVLPIQVPGMPAFDVRCDMETDGGGWIVLQRRVDDRVSFQRGWTTYKNGFGDLNGNFWLGLEKIHKLAGPGKGAILRVDLKGYYFLGLKYAIYRKFEISDETGGYKLTIGQYRGNAGDSLKNQNGMKFSTVDRDNDAGNDKNCASNQKGAWWYNNCHHSNLNGLYAYSHYNSSPYYMSWSTIGNRYGGIYFAEMKIRYASVQ